MLGLKYKFMLLAAVIVALSSLIWGGWIMHNEKKILLENTINKSRLVVTSFKDSIISAIIDDEQNNNGRGSLDSIIEEIVDNTQFQAVYAYVSDVGGVVVAHNNMAECGKTYQDPLASEALEKDLLQYGFSGPLHNVSSTIDMAVPLGVNGKRWGVLRAGFF